MSEDAGGLVSRMRRPRGQAAGALVLLHGRGADEHDLFPLLELLDPERRLLGVSPRAPLSLPPGGAHWYVVREVGYPDPATFLDTFAAVERWLDGFLERSGLSLDKTVIGGFSQGAVMAYALGLGAGRPRPAGLIALSGFIPRVEGFEIELDGSAALPVAIGHGVYDPVIGVEWGRDARARLEAAGAHVLYRESPLPHAVDPGFVEDLRPWLQRTLAGSAEAGGAS